MFWFAVPLIHTSLRCIAAGTSGSTTSESHSSASEVPSYKSEALLTFSGALLRVSSQGCRSIHIRDAFPGIIGVLLCIGGALLHVRVMSYSTTEVFPFVLDAPLFHCDFFFKKDHFKLQSDNYLIKESNSFKCREVVGNSIIFYPLQF